MKQLLSALNTVLELPGENFLIIDALDECPAQENGRDELCKHLKDLATSERLHILVTGRNEPDLEDGLVGSNGLARTSIRNSLVDADIRLYVQSQLEVNPRFKRMTWLSEVKDDILQTLESKSRGM